jgi:pimeloyl-ACP methyl ester carboxylesterase
MGRATLGWLENLPRYRTIAAAGGMAGLFDVLSKEDPATREALARRPEDLPRYQAAFEQVDVSSFLAIATACAERADRSGEISQVTIPTLALVGSLDAPFVDPARRFVEATGGQIQVLAGAGHVPMLDQPHLVAEAIDAFCSALGGPS